MVVAGIAKHQRAAARHQDFFIAIAAPAHQREIAAADAQIAGFAVQFQPVVTGIALRMDAAPRGTAPRESGSQSGQPFQWPSSVVRLLESW